MTDERPPVDVQPAEYIRLLGFPPGWELRDRSLELATWAREWYAANGSPALRTRHVEAAIGESVVLGGVAFQGRRLRRLLADAGADRAILAAVTAGPELEAEAHRLWQDGKPDEYFFLEMFGSAVVEHLVTMAGAKFCAWAEPQGLAVLAHDSPGYPEWPIEDQAKLWRLMNDVRLKPDATYPDATFLEVLDSGMLRPKKSLLAVFGVTSHVDRVRPLSELIPCEGCSFLPCQFRRAPYRAAGAKTIERTIGGTSAYTVNAKALERWSRERLTFERRDEDGVEATFRYEGTTCSNMGRPLAFEYRVKLGPRAEGYPIRAEHCAPAAGDDGHTFMCKYISHRDELMGAISRESPLLDQPLDAVMRWERPHCATGCYCDAEARTHKWGLVLETIHYALGKER